MSAAAARRSTVLSALEKTFFVMTRPDTAFEILSDPVRLPDYVPTLRLIDSVAVEGELELDANLAEREGAPEAGFTADRATRRIEWGSPGTDYGGSIEISGGTGSTATVTLRLHTRDDADAAEVARLFDQAVGNIRRLLSGR